MDLGRIESCAWDVGLRSTKSQRSAGSDPGKQGDHWASKLLAFLFIFAVAAGEVHAQKVIDPTISGSVEGSVSEEDPDDWYQFTLRGRGTLELEISGLEADADLCLYSSSVQIAAEEKTRCHFSDNAALVVKSSRRSSATDSVGWSLLPGTYYIRVNSFDSVFTLYTMSYSLAPPPELRLLPRDLTIVEGSTGTYSIELTNRPSEGDVVVTLESSDTTALTISSARLVFTSENWNISQEITVTAKDDDDADDETVTITHQTVGLFAGDQTVTDNVIVTVRDDDMTGVIVEPLMLEVDEGSSESYTVRLRSAPPGDGEVRVTVRSDNLDVTVTPSTQTFTASDWSSPKEFTVTAIPDDDHDNARATLTHEVMNYGEVTADDVVVTVIELATSPSRPRDLVAIPGNRQVTLQWREPENDGGSPIVRYDYNVDDGAWISTGGTGTRYVVDGLDNSRTYTFQVRAINAINEESPESDSVSTPVTATPTTSREERAVISDAVEAVAAVTVANVTANIGTRFSAARSAAPVVRLAGQNPVSRNGPKSWTPAGYGLGTGLDSGVTGRSWSPDSEEMLRSSSFEIPLGAEVDGQGGMGSVQWTLWGRGDLQYFSSQPPSGSSYEGDLTAAYVGVDAWLGDQWLAGLAASMTEAEADYDLGDGSGGDGRLEMSLTGLHPYLRYAPNARSEFWAILGAGQGEIENISPGNGTPESSDITMWMGAAGARRSVAVIEALDLALLGDIGIAHVETEDGLQAVDGLTVDSWRLRVGAEGSRTTVLENGGALTAFMEIAGRIDGGDDGENEFGLEMSPGLSLFDTGTGVGVEMRGRLLALHTAENYREHGVSMTVSLSPGPDGSGLSLSLSPRWGTGTDGEDALLWRDRQLERLAHGKTGHERVSLDSRIGYGIRAGLGVFTPFGEYGLQEERSQRVRVGLGFRSGVSGLQNLNLELSAERRESFGRDPEHRAGLIGRLQF